MTRTAWVLLTLAVLTNAAWLLSRRPELPPPDPEPAASPRALDRAAELEGRVRALTAELSAERAALTDARAEVKRLGEVHDVLWPKGQSGRNPSPERRPRTRRREPSSMAIRAHAIAEVWRQAGLSAKDASERTAAIETIRWAIEHGDPDQMLAGLTAFCGLHDLQFDRASFREPILRRLDSPETSIRGAALWALRQAGHEEGDLERVLALKDDTALRPSLAYAITWLTKGDIRGAAAKVLLEFLESTSLNEVKATLHGISGARLSPDLEARVLELARQPETRYTVIYYCLSGRAEISKDAVEVMLEAMGDSDPNCASRAIWGLRDSVVPECREEVADAFLEYLVKRPNSGSVTDLLWGLRTYARRRHREVLAEMAENEAFSDDYRKRLQKVVGKIR